MLYLGTSPRAHTGGTVSSSRLSLGAMTPRPSVLHRPELLEAPFEKSAVRSRLSHLRNPHGGPVEPLEACQERAVVGVEDAAGDVDLEVRVHADQVGVEGRVVERGHADSVGDGCGAALIVRLDVRADEELSQRQVAERAAVSIDRPDMLAEPGLVIAAPGRVQRIGPLPLPDGCVGPRPFIGNGVPARRALRREQDAPFIRPEVPDPHREDRLVQSGPHGTKVDQRRPPSMGEFKRGVCVTRGFPGQVVGKQPRLNVKFGALVAVPGGPAGAWHRRPDAEGRSHLPWLEYPQRPAGEMDPLALVQEPFRYLGPRNRPAGGNCQPFQRRERLRAYGPVGVAVLVYPIGHIVSGLTNLTEDDRHAGDAPGRGAPGPGGPRRFARADVVARFETARAVAGANDLEGVHPCFGIGDDVESSAHGALPVS